MSNARDWEQRYEDRAMPWEKGSASPGLVDYLEAQPLLGRILVPGCGYGHDARAIADAGGDAVSVLGLDVAPSAVRGARERTPHVNCAFEVGDILDLAEGFHGAFDAVWEHTCFCAIDVAARGAYARSVAAVLKPGGLFLAMFYMTPDVDRGEGPPFGCSIEELEVLFGAAFELVTECVPERAYPGREGRELMRLSRRR